MGQGQNVVAGSTQATPYQYSLSLAWVHTCTSNSGNSKTTWRDNIKKDIRVPKFEGKISIIWKFITEWWAKTKNGILNVTLIAYLCPDQRWSSWRSIQSAPLMCMHWGEPPCSPPPAPAGAGFASLSLWTPYAPGSGPLHWTPRPHIEYRSQSIDQPTCTCTQQ